MAYDSLTIQDLPYLERIPTAQCMGGDVYTDTYAGSGVAVAVAVASASGELAQTRTRTSAVVRENPHVTISRATAVAVSISYTEHGIQRERSSSRSFYISFS
jgi:hypothetical protein